MDKLIVKNSNNKKDFMLTFAIIAFTVVTLNIFLGSLGNVNIFGADLHMQVIDSSVMAVYLGATFTAYVSRRFTDTKYGQRNNSVIEEVVNEVTGEASDFSESHSSHHHHHCP